MDFTFQQYEESAQAIRARLGGFAPKVAMILGSGLGYLGDQVEGAVTVPYGEIPYFKSSTAPGHKGRLVFGTLEGQRVAVMQGRMHHYEGYSYEEVSYAVRVLRLFSQSPLRGENLPEFGVRFPDASKLYTPRLQELARQTAQEQGLTLREGVYFYCYGPQYETPAEVRAARILGGDAVGMSTAPEVVVAGHCGMEVLGITLLSNMAAGILDQPLSEREVLDAAEAAKEKFSGLIRACLRRM
jgi:purine-nucleoside phosphorylase